MENKEMLDNLPILGGGVSIDAKKYKGFKTKIAEVRIEEVVDWYTGKPDDKGRPTYNPNSTDKKKIVVIETQKLPKMSDDGKPLAELTDTTVKRRFNLKKEVASNGEVIWGISHADKAELWKFLKNMEVEKPSDLVGKEVMLTTEADRDDPKKFWLRISD